jgi:endonuclease III related protein
MRSPGQATITTSTSLCADEDRYVASLLMEYYRRLRARFGFRNWWPADSPFEVCVGAVLTQNTSWKNVVKAIVKMKDAVALDPLSIHALNQNDLAELIRPCGYFNLKAARLKNLVRHFVEHHGGDLAAMFASPLESLRAELLSVNGVGKETADSIVLYAANQPVFVVDAYTKRVLLRHGLLPGKGDYDSTQGFFHRHVCRDVDLFKDFHAQFVAVGHYYCKRKLLCAECPLERFLPSDTEPPQTR